MIKRLLIMALAVGVSGGARAQLVTQSTPKGEVRTAAVGGAVWESAKFTGAPGVILGAAVQANWGSAEIVDLPPGTALMTIRAKKLKACRERIVTRMGGYSFGGWKDCLIDTNQDGLFDRVSFNEVAGAKDIVPPVAYTKEMVPVDGIGSASFRKIVTYLGRSGSDIRLSYREFSNDMARPAFTEDLTLPVPETFPQTMQVKDLKLTLLGIGPSGLTYRIE